MELTAEEKELQRGAIEFARANLGTDLVTRDATATFSREGWRRCAEFGVLGMPVPVTYGGSALGAASLIAVMEGLGYGAGDSGLLFSINAHLWTNTLPILTFGTDDQKERHLPGLCDGTVIGANGASEPDAGSDVFSMRTRATRRGDDYVLDGSKTWVTNAPVADLFVVYATIDPALGPMGVTAFIVPRDTPGLSIGPPIHKMGLRTSPMAELFFDGCVVPSSARLGREGRGIGVFECSMEWERGCILAAALGIMWRQLDRCIEHARSRRQFGQPIGKFQSVANRIVDMRVRLDTSRALVYRIGRLKDAGRDAFTETAIAKLHVADALIASMMDAMQVFGGAGYTTDLGIERDLRDAMASRIYSGTSEIQRAIIARRLGL